MFDLYEINFFITILSGAVTQEFFVRKNSVKAGVELKANTHLILMKPEGSKYDASLKWKIPCVSKEWLIECLNARKRLPDENFSLDFNNQTLDTTISRVENKLSKSNTNSAVDKSKNEQLTSFDMSKRGASIMDGFDSVTRPNIAVEETQQGPLSKATGSKTFPGDKSTVAGGPSLHDISSGKCLETDFSSFNTMISKESTSITTTTTTVCDDNENNNSFTIPLNKFDSPKFALDKSRFSFDCGEALEGIPSPAPNSSQDLRRKSNRKSRGSLPIGIQFSEALQRAVDKNVSEEEKAAMEEIFTKRVSFLFMEIYMIFYMTHYFIQNIAKISNWTT